MLLSYSNCLILTYTRVDLMAKYIFSPIYRRIFCQKIKFSGSGPLEENKLNCNKLVSGNLLDILYLVNMRLLFWFVFKIWLDAPPVLKYCKNCGFEIDFSTFKISMLGVILIMSVNVLITFAIFFFMKIKGEIIFEYKMDNNVFAKILNVFSLVFFSILIDSHIQIGYLLK